MFERAKEKCQILKAAVEVFFLRISYKLYFIRELCSLKDEASSHGSGKGGFVWDLEGAFGEYDVLLMSCLSISISS